MIRLLPLINETNRKDNGLGIIENTQKLFYVRVKVQAWGQAKMGYLVNKEFMENVKNCEPVIVSIK